MAVGIKWKLIPTSLLFEFLIVIAPTGAFTILPTMVYYGAPWSQQPRNLGSPSRRLNAEDPRAPGQGKDAKKVGKQVTLM